jgi:WD40 repeat protein
MLKKYHTNIANYFKQSVFFFDGYAQKKPNIRKCAEQPWQQTKAEMWDEVTETLCDLDFIQVKCAAKMTYDLVKDYHFALEGLPEAQPERERNAKWEKYSNELIEYVRGDIETIEVPQCEKPWVKEKINREIERIKNKPNRYDKLSAFINFLGVEADNLAKFAYELPNFTVQQAWNYTNGGPVGKAAEKKYLSEHKQLLLQTDLTRPLWNPIPQVLKIMQAKKLLRGIDNVIFDVSVTPDMKLLISASADKDLILWDLNTGQPIRTLKGHTDCVYAVSMTPDGKFAVSGSLDETCIVWDLQSGQSLIIFKGHADSVISVCIAPGDKYVISSTRDKSLIMWDRQTGDIIKNFNGHSEVISSIAVSLDMKYMFTGSPDKTVIIWNLNTGQISSRLNGHTGSVTAVSITPDGRYAVSGSTDNSLIYWDCNDGKMLQKLEGHKESVHSVSITPDGSLAVSGAYDKKLIVWDLKTGKILNTLIGHLREIDCVQVSPNGRYAVSGSRDATLILWNIEKGVSIQFPRLDKKEDHILCVTPSGRYVISGLPDYTLVVWEKETGLVKRILKEHKDKIRSVEIGFNENFMISNSYDGNLNLWNLDTGKAVKTMKKHSNGYPQINFLPDNKHSLVDSGNGLLDFISIETGEVVHILDGHASKIVETYVSIDGRMVLSLSLHDNYLILWDLNTGKKLKIFEPKTWRGYTDNPDKMLITPDNKCVITGYGDGLIIVSDLLKGEKIKGLQRSKNSIKNLMITPDGRRAISCDYKGVIIVWDLVTSQVYRVLEGQHTYIWPILVTVDGKHIITSGSDHTAIVHDLKSGQILARVCGVKAVFLFNKGLFGYGDDGRVSIFKTGKDILCPGPGIITLRHIWDFQKQQYFPITADCPFCGHRFEPEKKYIDTIKGILRNGNIGPEDSPCLKLSKEAWDELGLFSECPKCHEAIRFNPFIAGGD